MLQPLNGHLFIETYKQKPIKNEEGIIVNNGAIEKYAKVIAVAKDVTEVVKGDTVMFEAFSVNYEMKTSKGKLFSAIKSSMLIGKE